MDIPQHIFMSIGSPGRTKGEAKDDDDDNERFLHLAGIVDRPNSSSIPKRRYRRERTSLGKSFDIVKIPGKYHTSSVHPYTSFRRELWQGLLPSPPTLRLLSRGASK